MEWRGNVQAIRRVLSALALIVITAAVAGCGAQPTPSSNTSVTDAPAATATTPPTPTPQPTVDPAALARCNAQQTPQDAVVQAGDILMFKPTSPMNYPAVQLPDQTPLKPLQVPVQVSNNAFSQPSKFPGAVPTNPGGLTGSMRTFQFVASICNGSASQSHVVQSVSVRIASLTPYTGSLMVWPGCDTAFSRQYPNVGTGGCGGGVATEEQVQATFASGAQAGTTVIARQTGFSDATPNESITALPFTLASGKGLSFQVSVAVPDMAGTYAFTIGFKVDGAAAAFGPPADSFLAAPVAHTFTGSACNTSAMLAQIPAATTPETYYICPQ